MSGDRAYLVGVGSLPMAHPGRHPSTSRPAPPLPHAPAPRHHRRLNPRPRATTAASTRGHAPPPPPQPAAAAPTPPTGAGTAQRFAPGLDPAKAAGPDPPDRGLRKS